MLKAGERSGSRGRAGEAGREKLLNGTEGSTVAETIDEGVEEGNEPVETRRGVYIPTNQGSPKAPSSSARSVFEDSNCLASADGPYCSVSISMPSANLDSRCTSSTSVATVSREKNLISAEKDGVLT